MILSVSGSLLGFGVAALGTRMLLKFASPLPLEIFTRRECRLSRPDIYAGCVTGDWVLFSILPACRSTKLDLSGIPKAGDAGLEQGRTRMLGRNALVIG
jgi:hypothetical protein